MQTVPCGRPRSRAPSGAGSGGPASPAESHDSEHSRAAGALALRVEDHIRPAALRGELRAHAIRR